MYMYSLRRYLSWPFFSKNVYCVFIWQHSHLSTTEVIGLLGGDFDPEQAILEVSIARPCRSLSTGMQCEMDPGNKVESTYTNNYHTFQ